MSEEMKSDRVLFLYCSVVVTLAAKFMPSPLHAAFVEVPVAVLRGKGSLDR